MICRDDGIQMQKLRRQAEMNGFQFIPCVCPSSGQVLETGEVQITPADQGVLEEEAAAFQR